MNFLTTNANIATYRRIAMTDFRNILLELSKDPAMLYWLDNNENHKSEINENYGRESYWNFFPWVWTTTLKTI